MQSLVYRSPPLNRSTHSLDQRIVLPRTSHDVVFLTGQEKLCVRYLRCGLLRQLNSNSSPTRDIA